MTFATKVHTIHADREIFAQGCKEKCPLDFWIFSYLIQQKKRTLASCIPGVSTHGETMWLSLFVDWDKELKYSLNL
jgi:hypothetical protein